MQLAIHTSAYSDYGLPEALSMAAAAGYRSVEIAADLSENRHFEAHKADDEAIGQLQLLLERHRIELAAIDIGGWDTPLCVVNRDEVLRRQAVANLGCVAAAAAQLDCPLLTSHLWGAPVGDGAARRG